VDSTDQELGPVIGAGDILDKAVVALKINGVLFSVFVFEDGFEGIPSNPVWYDSTDCSDPPWLEQRGERNSPIFPNVSVSEPGNTVYLEDPNGTPHTFTNQSLSLLFKDSQCEVVPIESITLFPAIALLNLFSLFTPPFTIEPMPAADLQNHTHTYQTGKTRNHNQLTVNTGPAEPVAP